ncbi:hypothetical protein U1Q18_018229 [Sarracenia purpurea var. burkii]
MGKLEGSCVGRNQTLDGWEEGDVERRARGFGPPPLTRSVAPAVSVGGTTNPWIDRLLCHCGSKGRGVPDSNPRRLDRYKGSQPSPGSEAFRVKNAMEFEGLSHFLLRALGDNKVLISFYGVDVSLGFLLQLGSGELLAVCSAAVFLWVVGLGFGCSWFLDAGGPLYGFGALSCLVD